MARHFDVVGDEIEGDEIEGDVMGDVMGDEEVVGIVRRNVRTGRQSVVRASPRTMAIPAKPNWRRQLAPGVIQPDEGMVVLPMSANAGTPPGTFSASVTSITFQGQLQKPYRAERLLTSSVRTGTSAVGRLLGVLYVGTDLQQAEIAGWDIELVGQANSFGTRLTCKAAEPGVFIRLVVSLSTALAGTDTIFCNVQFLGRIIA
jgi:hypothetical protein